MFLEELKTLKVKQPNRSGLVPVDSQVTQPVHKNCRRSLIYERNLLNPTEIHTKKTKKQTNKGLHVTERNSLALRSHKLEQSIEEVSRHGGVEGKEGAALPS